MQADWIPPDQSGARGVGTDEDLAEREAGHPSFMGEFAEREGAPPRESEETADEGEERPR